MAHMNQEKKAKIAAELKKVMPADWKWSLGVRHHSTIVMTIRSAPVDLIAMINENRADTNRAKAYADVNVYHADREFGDVEVRALFSKIINAMIAGNHNRSDISTDYFDVGWYVDLNIGQWNKPFICTGEMVAA